MALWENQSETFKDSVRDGLRRFMRTGNRKRKIEEIFYVNRKEVRK